MGIEEVGLIFEFLGGLGMFLFGMDLMAKGLQQSAGGRMKKWLGILTRNRLMGVLLGALITAVIQSSSATTVMIVGFVNAGLMNLTQAVGVIMGANIGTTMTAWLVSMNEWGSALKPEFFAPLLIGIGALMLLFTKKEAKKLIGEILVGFGILFIGLGFMSGAIEPYRDAPIFQQIFMTLGQNPILGLLAGAGITAIIQSSSASVGILQALAMNGVVSWNAAVFITLGQNIGTCVTALIASAGAHRNAKRAAIIHLLFNVFGSVWFGVVCFLAFQMRPEFAASAIDSVGISIFHTVFNVSNTLVLFPFANFLVKAAEKLLPISPEEEADPVKAVKQRIGEYRIDKPAFALEAATHEVMSMGNLCLENTKTAIHAVKTSDEEAIKKVLDTELTINELEKILTEFLIKLNGLSLSGAQARQLRNLVYSVNDLERVGDHAKNLAELAQGKIRESIVFSDVAQKELDTIGQLVIDAMEMAFAARTQNSLDLAKEVCRTEDKVDQCEEDFRAEHIGRLSRGECTAQAGVIFLDVISNLERICDHADNVAGYVKDEANA